MDLHTLPFAKVIILSDKIAEIIVDDGIELTGEMVEEFQSFLLTHMGASISLLVNIINSYTYDFDAQRKLGEYGRGNKKAIVSYNRASEIAVDYLMKTSQKTEWDTRTFDSRDKALEWLKSDELNYSQVNSHK